MKRLFACFLAVLLIATVAPAQTTLSADKYKVGPDISFYRCAANTLCFSANNGLKIGKVEVNNTCAPGDASSIVACHSSRVEVSPGDPHAVIYGSTGIGDIFAIHMTDPTDGRATAYIKQSRDANGHGGGGSWAFQSQLPNGHICVGGVVGHFGAVTGSTSYQDDFAFKAGNDPACNGSGSIWLLGADSGGWRLTSDGNLLPQSDSSAVTIGYTDGHAVMQFSNEGTTSFKIRDKSLAARLKNFVPLQWTQFDNGGTTVSIGYGTDAVAGASTLDVNGKVKATNVEADAVAVSTRILGPGALLPTASTVKVVCLGDSICGYSLGGDTYTAMLNNLPVLKGRSATPSIFSYSGQTIAYIASQYTANVHPLSPAVTGTPGLLMIEGGANDILSVSLATMESGMSGLLTAAKADGWTVGVSTVMLRSEVAYQASDSDVRVPFNNWLRTQYQAGAFDYLFDWDALISNPFDTQVLSDGVHPTVSTRNLMARQMNDALGGELASSRASSTPFGVQPTNYLSFNSEGGCSTGADGWVYLGRWNTAYIATGNNTRSLTLTLMGEGGSYAFGVLRASITYNAAQTPPVNALTNVMFYAFDNGNNASQSPDIEKIKFVVHPGTSAPSFDWDVYAQVKGPYGQLRSSGVTNAASSWDPVMTCGASDPGADGDNVKSATLANIVNTGASAGMLYPQSFGAYRFNVTNSDGTTGAYITGGGPGNTWMWVTGGVGFADTVRLPNHAASGNVPTCVDTNGGTSNCATSAFTGTKTAGACTLSISNGIITNVTGC